MTEVRALFYADRHAFVNVIRRSIRSPGRIALWLVYVLAFVAFIASRVFAGRYTTSDTTTDILRADYLICGQVLALALVLAFGAGRVGFFRTPAEARFVIGSSVRAPIAIAYLQARDSLSSAFRWISSLFYFAFVFAPHHLSVLAAGTDVLIVAAIFASTKAIGITRKLAPRPWQLVSIVAGVSLALAPAAVIVRDLAQQIPISKALTAPVLHAIPAIHPGLVLIAPNPLWLLIPIAILAPAIAMLASAGRDAYPELYALSVMQIEHSGSRAERRGRKDRARVSRALIRVPAPPGSLVLVWKTVIEFRRLRPNVVVTVVGAVAWIAIGYALARIEAAAGPAFLGALSTLLFAAIVMLGFIATTSLASELRKPLFWVCGFSLFERLAALAVAYNIRKISTLVLIACGVAAGGGTAIDIVVVALVMPVLVLLIGSVGFSVYALVPNAGTGGPIPFLRVVISLLLLAPVATAGIVGGIFGGPVVAAGGVMLPALGEFAALIALAAWRIDGRIDRVYAP